MTNETESKEIQRALRIATARREYAAKLQDGTASIGNDADGDIARCEIDADVIESLCAALRRAETERDAQAALVATLTAERDEARVQLRAANDFLRVVTLERDHAQQVEVPDAFWRLDEAQAQVWGLICAGTNIDEIRRRTFEALAQNVNSGRDLIKVMIFYQRERDEARAQLRELESTSDLLTAENARLQREHDAYVQRLSADALQVASKYQRDLDEARAQIATLELLQRGEK